MILNDVAVGGDVGWMRVNVVIIDCSNNVRR